MAVSAPGATPPVTRERPTENVERPETRERPESRYSQDPGGNTPSDFGHRDPDYNHDGTVSDAESRTYDSELRHEDRVAAQESRERMAHEKEEGKNYRAELSARTAEVQSNNDNKMHKMFGKQSAQPPMPTRPDGPSPS
jgi:hypothetical protein